MIDKKLLLFTCSTNYTTATVLGLTKPACLYGNGRSLRLAVISFEKEETANDIKFMTVK